MSDAAQIQIGDVITIEGDGRELKVRAIIPADGDPAPAPRRSSLALAMLCAWNNIPPDKAPPDWWDHPSDENRRAWERVAEAARRHIANESRFAPSSDQEVAQNGEVPARHSGDEFAWRDLGGGSGVGFWRAKPQPCEEG